MNVYKQIFPENYTGIRLMAHLKRNNALCLKVGYVWRRGVEGEADIECQIATYLADKPIPSPL